MFADRLGSVIEVVEAATGTVISSQRFDSFGLRTATGPLLQRYGFTGREHDTESGLIYYRARAYDPAVGMFLQRDPIGFSSGDLNLYAYTWNDPYNWKDPSGLSAVTDFAVLSAGLVGLGTACYTTGACQNAGKAAGGIGGLIGGVLNMFTDMWNRLFSQGNDGSGSGGASGGGGPGSGMGDNGGPKMEPEGPDPAAAALATALAEIARLINGATELPKTKGRTTLLEKDGGFSQANRDL